MIHTGQKQLVIFDLDGTLAESKQVIDAEMASLLAQLLDHRIVAVISGGSLGQFKKQFLPPLSLTPEQYQKLVLLPTSGASFYHFANGNWQIDYEERLSNEEVAAITHALEQTVAASGESLTSTYGAIIEFRGTQITYSALGQEAPLELKQTWDPDQAKRLRIVSLLAPLLPGYSIRIGGTTSIDINRGGIDKAYGIRALQKHFSIPLEDMIFVGDALFPGGNDAIAKETGVDCVAVKNVAETKQFIKNVLPPS